MVKVWPTILITFMAMRIYWVMVHIQISNQSSKVKGNHWRLCNTTDIVPDCGVKTSLDTVVNCLILFLSTVTEACLRRKNALFTFQMF